MRRRAGQESCSRIRGKLVFAIDFAGVMKL
jgi:hypothetical protein